MVTQRRIQAHSSNIRFIYHVTKVLQHRIAWIAAVSLLFFPLLARCEVPGAQKPAEVLYLQLGQVGLDPSRVYQVRSAAINRPGLEISLEDGTIAFTQDVMGRITGAFFEGYGEVLLTPPNEVERRSMNLFTGMAILEERFETAYFRFNDAAEAELVPDLRETQNKQEFVDRWQSTAQNLAAGDAMRLLVSFSRMLPVSGVPPQRADSLDRDPEAPDRFLHARLQGSKLGIFDVYYDSTRAESLQAGQSKKAAHGDIYYDVWASFSPVQGAKDSRATAIRQPALLKPITVHHYKIETRVLPPTQIRATALLQCDVAQSGMRVLLFELSRFLQVRAVKLNGQTVEFIHNPALEGTQLSRQGNDIVAVILPQPTIPGQAIQLEFEYEGEVLADAGPGLLYVGARGTWYPNLGMQMADFDLQFTYPPNWTLVATGKRTTSDNVTSEGEKVSHWVSERPIPVAGFNLGKYREAIAHAGTVSVETYATQNVEKDFPTAHIQVVNPGPIEPSIVRPPEVIVPQRPSPAQNVTRVGEAAAQAIEYFAERFGPFPYSHLALTQMPGRDSQGWPGLVFLSSYAFLNDDERQQLHFEPYRILIQHEIPAHETAHQWWGDLVSWTGYRDQWLSEGLANYCTLMMLQQSDPAGFSQIMEKYRDQLLEKNSDALTPMEVGPVTLGTRLYSSQSPEAYEAIIYGRGTWLFHMLRTMLKDADSKIPDRAGSEKDEPFIRSLRTLRERYQGQAISTQQLLEAFARDLPPSLQFEGKRNLDWFLDSWINGTALPRLELKNVRLIPKGAGLVVSGTILQKDAPPDLVTSVPVYAVIPGRQPILLTRVFADGTESSFRLTAPAGTRKILLDPYKTVLTRAK
jgi:hypothetical protein